MPRFALKNNLLGDATLSFNLATELRISKRYTLDLGMSYNPWTLNNNRKFKHLLIQPELRTWLCEPFYGHFFGIHSTFAVFNVGNIDIGSLKGHRYEGYLGGVGFSYGYHWVLSPRWSIEATLGFGYLYMDYDRFKAIRCGELEKSHHKHYVGPTKIGISFVYMLK